MIGKIERQPVTEYVQIERTIKEPEPQFKESVVSEKPTRESSQQTANARKNEMAITSSNQKAILDSQIQLSAKQTDVAIKHSEPIADSPNIQTLKLGDKGTEVYQLMDGLRGWQNRIGLEPTPRNEKGEYTVEIEKAVKEFQIASNLPPTGKADPTTQRRLKLENDPNFRVLDNEVKQKVRFTLNQYAHQPDAQENLLKLATDKQFAHLISKDSQTSAIAAFVMHPADKNHLKNIQDAIVDVAILEKEKTLDKLPESTKRQVIITIFKKTENLPNHTFGFDSSKARQDVIDLAKSPEFAGLTESQQRKMLDAVAANPDQSAAYMSEIIKSNAFKSMDKKMKERVIDLAYENTMYPVLNGVKYASDYIDRVDRFLHLIINPKFQAASEEDKWAQLNTLRPPSDRKKEIDIL